MKSFILNNKYLILLIFVFIVSEVIVNPLGNFPLNDDWSYSKSVSILLNKGNYTIGDWGAMTLFTHLIWGFLFTKIFGFSFFVLRISTIISSIIGLLVLNKLIFSITKNKLLSVLICLTLLFNPLYFNLTNTYMTDVNFNTLVILCCYFAYSFFKTNKIWFLFLVFICSTLLILLRQYGVIVPLCFTFSCLFLKNKKWLYTLLSVILTICVLAIFKYYENYIKNIVGVYSAYKFSGKFNPIEKEFWDIFLYHLDLRYAQIILNILFYTFPIAIIFVLELLKNFKILFLLLVFGVSCISVYFLTQKQFFPMGNIFTNMSLGAETFYQNLGPNSDKYCHTYSPLFEKILVIVKYSFSSITFFVLILFSITILKSKKINLIFNPQLIFIICFLFSYIFMLLVTESYFDRYHIPLITIFLIFLSFANNFYRMNYKWIFIPLIFLFYISVFGTKDYMTLNDNRWEAYKHLKLEKSVPTEKINGGFEINCWNEGRLNWWFDFFNVDNFDYLIQYKQEKGFKVYRQFTFQRYFPYRKDTLRIFVKDTINKK